MSDEPIRRPVKTAERPTRRPGNSHCDPSLLPPLMCNYGQKNPVPCIRKYRKQRTGFTPPALSLRSSFGEIIPWCHLCCFNPHDRLKKSVSKRIKTTFTDSAVPTSWDRHQLAYGYGGGRTSTCAEATMPCQMTGRSVPNPLPQAQGAR